MNFIKKHIKKILILTLILVSFFGILLTSKEDGVVRAEPKIKTVEETKKTVFVDIKGAVNKPGVYELDEGKRVIDAVIKAGGLAKDSETGNVNLAKKLTDEMLIIIYTKKELNNYKKESEQSCVKYECICPNIENGACINTSSDTKTSTGKISINSASKEELMTLTGIGDSKAQAIIDYRKENGPFKSIDDLSNVKGISTSIINKIKNQITL